MSERDPVSQIAKLEKSLTYVSGWLKSYLCPTDLAKDLIVSPALQEISLNDALDELKPGGRLTPGNAFSLEVTPFGFKESFAVRGEAEGPWENSWENSRAVFLFPHPQSPPIPVAFIGWVNNGLELFCPLNPACNTGLI